MKASRPPALATWLLEHLLPKCKSEVVAGDLIETFGEQGSAAWYWRQVRAAIVVGLLQELRVRWTAILWAIVFTCAVPWQHIGVTPQFQFMFFFGIRLPWPFSLVSQIAVLTLVNAVMLVIALGLYLAVVRYFNAYRFSQALLVALPVLVLGINATLWSFTLSLPRFVGALTVRLPLFFGLLTSMWIVAQNMTRADSQNLPVQHVPNA